ncbi:Six-hairpin glycosidase-like protein [Aspergillus ambiguus]|uniref:Six-hairpin glycosidase-like protein n=1 Tax=Aspergillus ambiguus TaxID=176160 RepID=UPI003CCE00FA
MVKIWRTAVNSFDQRKLPHNFPDNVPSTGSRTGKYTFSDISAWTSGFFPGSLYILLERSMKYPKYALLMDTDTDFLHEQLRNLAHSWSNPLHGQASRTDTHDMGFIILPALRRDWELTGNFTSLESIITAAHNLASRYDARVGAVRSWDSLENKRHNITDREANFLVIIDSMCNMDLLFYVGYHTGNQTLVDIATTHAHTVLQDIVRDDYSTFHCCNIDPRSDAIKFQETVQGYKDWSTWSRGQAWGILGYIQTYKWTKDPIFLKTARGLAEYFIKRLASATHDHPYVPLWDFDAPPALQGQSPYYGKAMEIMSQTIDLSFSDPATVMQDSNGEPVFSPVGWDSILMNATINNNEYAFSQSNNTGLVYADYYFLQFGNLLLEMGFV